jgi:hypothetical protein
VSALRLPAGPVGILHGATLVLSVGTGAWFTCWAIYLTRSVGMSAAQFGVGVTLAGLLSLVAGGPLGFLADRVGAREVLVALSLAQSVSVLCYPFTRGFWVFFAVNCVSLTAQRTLPAIRIAALSVLTEGRDRLLAISTARVVSHIGLAVGSAVGALILYLDNRPAYLALVLVYGVASAGSAAIVARVPAHRPGGDVRAGGPRVLVLRDRPFLVITVLSALLALNWGMLGTAVPLWIGTQTGVPTWVAGVLTAFNAVVIVLLQNRFSRAGGTVPAAARLAVYCGIALAASCVLFAGTYHRTGPVAVALLMAAATAHVIGELLYVASGWGLSVGLTPPGKHGEYQGVFGTGPAAALMVAPVVMTSVVGWAPGGWLVLGALFLAAALPTVPASRWALRRQRPPFAGLAVAA